MKVIKRFKPNLLIACLAFSSLVIPAGANTYSTKQSGDKLPKNEVEKLLKAARSFSKEGEIERAGEAYTKLLNADSANYTYNYEMGLNYLKSPNNRFYALPYFQRAQRHVVNDTLAELYYYLGVAYHFGENYNDALENFRKYKTYVDSGIEKKPKKDLNEQIAQCESGIQLSVNSNKKILVRNIDKGVNTNMAEYAPVLTDNDSILLFSTRKNLIPRTTEGEDEFRDKILDMMYVSKVVNGKYLPGQKYIPGEEMVNELIKSSRNTVLVSLGWDQKQLISYKFNKLWHSEYKSGRWDAPKVYENTVNRSSYQPHGTLTADGNTIYFSSENINEQEKTHAGLDIFKSVKQADGKWGPAINLGPEINTNMDEDSPNISADGKVLYFSSKGHNSVGGYDVFYVKQDSSGNWGKVKNMGVPINSPGDDVHYIANKKGTQAYIASFRKDGFGDMDIYKIIKNREKPNFHICEQLAKTSYKVSLSAQTVTKLQDMPVNYTWSMGDGNTVSGDNIDYAYKKPGTYKVNLKVTDAADATRELENKTIEVNIDNVNYLEIASADTIKLNTAQTFDASKSMLKDQKITNYYWKLDNRIVRDSMITTHVFKTPGMHEVKLQIIAFNPAENDEQYYCLSKNVYVLPAPPATDTPALASENMQQIKSTINFETVYYDFNKFNIRSDAREGLDRNISMLKSNPESKIVISSHADSRGSDPYNFKLTRNRALATISYLLANGISRDRIVVAFSLGETKPVNQCKDGIACTDAEYQQNRRTEIYVATAESMNMFPKEYIIDENKLAMNDILPVKHKKAKSHKTNAGNNNQVANITSFDKQQLVFNIEQKILRANFEKQPAATLAALYSPLAEERKRSLLAIRRKEIEQTQA